MVQRDNLQTLEDAKRKRQTIIDGCLGTLTDGGRNLVLETLLPCIVPEFFIHTLL